MFKQQENKLFQSDDALSLEWDFIETKNIEVQEEKGIKIIVKINQETKMIVLNKSTLTLVYSLADLRRKIIQEFSIAKEMNLKIFIDNKRIMITNDLQLNHIQKMIGENNMEIQVIVEESKHCLLCMKSDCFHTAKLTADKKRKVENKSTVMINFLEPEKNLKNSSKKNTFHTKVSSSIKKRRIASPCNPNSKSDSHNLLIPFLN